jgi:hypothetical protein
MLLLRVSSFPFGIGKGEGNGGLRADEKSGVVDDFEVSIFLTEAGTRHSLLTKQKHFLDKKEGGMKSNANKLTGSGSAVASEAADTPFIPIEDDEDDNLLARIPSAPINEDDNEDSGLVNGSRRRTKRGRDGDGDDGMFVPDIDSEDERPPSKRIRDISQNYADEEDGQDDKKKLGMKTSYDGFSIYGKVLCLVVKRRGGIGTTKAANGGEAMMEGWIRSTQMPVEDLDDSQET